MNLFEYNQANTNLDKPLAYRMRPRNLEELFGQEHILAEGKLLNRAIKADRINSLILYGPPGTGKTSIAQVIANQTKGDFVRLNAVTSGVKELREVIDQARNTLLLHNKRTILFIDEIHRFNKAQQDALLPAVEEGIVILIGATTENPYFEVNSPLLSRSRIFRLNPLGEEDIINILKKALTDKERGLGGFNVEISPDELKIIARLSNGDARTALNALELAVLTTPPDGEGVIRINEEIIAESLQKKILNYDKDGDNHYDIVSAFIKSMRGSDPDAALFWLARMLEAGEDPKIIARRIIVHAAEDVGLADPMALLVAVVAARAVEFVGMPEAQIPLAEAVLYIATAAKSNSVYKGISAAMDYVRNNNTGSVPLHLRDASYRGAEKLGHGIDYKYPHDYPGHYVQQDYLPEGLKDLRFYYPGEEGKEFQIKERLKKLKGD
ncbi:MAG: replication-associated recombination protein A [Halanaerobiales bacterium]|nr:replication-associated recombination protein A [Bacillota bacterium]HOA41124.1 replication-associated recombination protein A [Halanaerobiales bacterium]HPZ63373.1 replication-associated recombination protein A [Halanaerobiales bacterium]HQD03913.1 replication-associated recombination protein A [Halanaerobiales bacterium]